MAFAHPPRLWSRYGPALALALVLLEPASGLAQHEADEPGPRVEWDAEAWPRVRPWEYGATGVALTGAFVARFAVPPAETNWRGGILFDDAVRDAVSVRSDPARTNLYLATDISFYGSMAYRLVDSLLVPGLGYGDWDLALQMSMIDLESFALVAAVLWGSQLLVRRERPYMRTCAEDEGFLQANADDDCDPESGDGGRSFIAGHTAVAVAAAGLTCMHHAHLPLYGRIGDDLACGVMIAQAAAQGIGRVITEKHYASDLLFAIALGGAAGWLLPAALHYGFWADDRRSVAVGTGQGRTRRAEGPRLVLVPNVGEREIGVAGLGIF